MRSGEEPSLQFRILDPIPADAADRVSRMTQKLEGEFATGVQPKSIAAGNQAFVKEATRKMLSRWRPHREELSEGVRAVRGAVFLQTIFGPKNRR